MFSMKDMGEENVILAIKIKRENKGIVITQSYYIEKILKKFNREDCAPVSTPMDPVEKLNPNTGKPVDQLEYSRAIGCLMYAMTSTRPDITYAIGRLSRFIFYEWMSVSAWGRYHFMGFQEANMHHWLPFIFKRKQFPVKLSYAMTINKSQGQSLERIGIFLPEPVFAHGQLLMAEANNPNTISTDKGKLPLVETNTISIADIKPTELNQTIEVRVYRKWTAKNVATQVSSKFCAILLDKQGNAIQANMDLKDTEYFNDLLQLNHAYMISQFRCTPTKAWDRTLPNDITLTFGKYTSIVPISNANFPEHYFNFIAYNEVDQRANKSGSPLTDYIGCIYRVSDPLRSGNATRSRRVRRIIDVQNLDGINLPFLIWGEMAESFDIDEYNRMEKPVIIAIASAWATKKYGGLQLSATSATQYYLNPNIPEATYILNTYAHFITPIPALEIQRQPYSNPLLEQTRNRYTIETLLSVNPQHYQKIRFTTEATLLQITAPNGWYYRKCNACNVQVADNSALSLYCFKAIINDGTAAATLTCFSPEAHTFVPDCNTVVNTIKDKDKTHMPTVLTQTEGHTYIFQFHFGQQAKPGFPNFTLDAILQPLTQPLLTLPAAENINSPATEVLEEPITDEAASNATKHDIQPPNQPPEEKAKKTRRSLFQDSDTQGKKPRQNA
ncbi:DNA helicase [Tanacetum coccineum]